MEQLKESLKEIYQKAGLNIHNFESDLESQHYGACQFSLDGQKVMFRIAKITPKKVGQFVVLWKKS